MYFTILVSDGAGIDERGKVTPGQYPEGKTVEAILAETKEIVSRLVSTKQLVVGQ
jgi:hypothetical protein